VAGDWRVTVTFSDAGQVNEVVRALREPSEDDEMPYRLGWGIALSNDRSHVFLYADTEAGARAAEGVVRDVLMMKGLTATGFGLDRWNPAEQRWQDASASLPEYEAAPAAEPSVAQPSFGGPSFGEPSFAERPYPVERPSRQPAGVMQPGWDVRAELRSHRQVTQLARRLRAQGWPVSQRWRTLTVGAADDDEVNALVQTLTEDGPLNVSVRPRT
jgi:hypothetical protein